MEHKQDLSFLKEYRKQNRTAQSYYDCGYNKGQEDLNRYRKALEEIEKICVQDRDIKDVCLVSTCFKRDRVVYDIQEEILYIINEAKGEGKCQ